MAEPPLSPADREAILRRTIREIEESADAEIRQSKEKHDLKKEIRVEIRYDARTGNETVKNAIVAKYLAAGWSKAYFELRTWRNETVYQLVLGQE